jgi:hypothetical protein
MVVSQFYFPQTNALVKLSVELRFLLDTPQRAGGNFESVRFPARIALNDLALASGPSGNKLTVNNSKVTGFD